MFTAWHLAAVTAALIAVLLGVRFFASNPGSYLAAALCLVAVWQAAVLVFPTPSGNTPCAEHASAGGVRTPIFHGGKAAVALEGAAAAPCIFRAQEAAESDRRGISFPSAQPGAVLACKVAGTVAVLAANFGCAQPKTAALVWSFPSAATPFQTGTTKPEIDFTLPVDAVDFLTWEDAK